MHKATSCHRTKAACWCCDARSRTCSARCMAIQSAGEMVAFDEDGKPSFNALQNYGSSSAPLAYVVFDLMVLSGRNVMHQPLEERLELLEEKVLSKLDEPIRLLANLDASLPDLIESVKASGMDGLVAKRGRRVGTNPILTWPYQRTDNRTIPWLQATLLICCKSSYWHRA